LSRYFPYLLLLSAFILIGAACTPAGDSTLRPSLSPLATPSPAPGNATRYPVNPASTESNLEQLDSYRAELSLDFEGQRAGQPAQGHIELLTEVDRPTEILHRTLTVEATIPNAQTSLDSTEFFQVADKVYLKRGNEKFWFEVKPGGPLSPGAVGLLQPERLIILPAAVAVQPNFERWNGLEVQHYRFTQDDLPAQPLFFEQAQGELWVTVTGRQVVQYVISGTARVANPIPNATLFDEGQLSLNYTLKDLNAALDLTPPPFAETIANPLADLPRLPDAQLTASFPTLIEYTSAISPVSATLFYQEQLSEQGWSEEAVTVFNERANLRFSKEDQALSIIINPDQSPQKFKVLINLQE
jgi:hypothetical protein